MPLRSRRSHSAGLVKRQETICMQWPRCRRISLVNQGSVDEAFVNAINSLHFRSQIDVEGTQVELVLLVHPSGWRPLIAEWWTEKEATLIGADTAGNFILRLSSGAVGYWSHVDADLKTISPSVRDFLTSIR